MATKTAKKSVNKTTAKKPVSKTVKTTVKTVTKNKTVFAKSKDFFGKYKSKQLVNGQFIAALVAEFIGTFLIVTFYMATQGDPRYSIYALVGIVLIIGGISGAYINPAMTISAWVTKKLNTAKAVGYLIAESLGAIAAWSILSAYVKGTATTAASMAPATVFTATPVAAGKEWYIFFAELIGAAILAFGLAAALKSRKNAEPAINSAFMYAGGLFVAMFITYIMVSPLGTGLVFFNPAVAFSASAVTAFKLWPIATYIIAPIIGGVLGFVLIDLLHSQIEIKVKEVK